MDVDTLVRHDLPVVMVMGNNSAWGLEKGPMQMLYGYDVVADLSPATRYDGVVRALGGGGETVTDPKEIGPALDRAYAAGVPYLVNVVTDVTRPTRAARSGSEAGRGDPARGPEDYAAVGELTVAAYAPFIEGPRDPYARASATRRGRAERPTCGWRSTTTAWSAPSPTRPRARATARSAGRRGRVPDARRRAGRAGAAAWARRWCSSASDRARAAGRPGVCSRRLAEMSAAHRVYERLGFRAPPSDWSPLPGVLLRRLRAWTKEL